jgi:hypothetical protein
MGVQRIATVLALLILGGCSWLHNWNTATLSYGVGDLYRSQILHNLQAFIDGPNAAPSGVNITSGFAATQTNANVGATIPLGDYNLMRPRILVSTEQAIKLSRKIRDASHFQVFGSSRTVLEALSL